MSLFSKTAFFLVTIIIVSSMFKGVAAKMNEDHINLPKNIDIWTKSDKVQTINSKTIFDYMNGAGEFYLGYRFKHLEVYEYKADGQDSIMVELYVMESSDDAFGLLSLDWGGESITFHSSPVQKTKHSLAPFSRALYGGGLLRIWSDNIYARVMAYLETPASKEVVLSLGRVIAAYGESPPEPQLLNILSSNIGPDWTLRNDRIGYFRSYLVLNSFYYISPRNILNLDHSTEAITAPYENITAAKSYKRIQFLFLEYMDHEHARKALADFHKAYLPEYHQDLSTKISNYFKIEDGWLGYKLYKKYIALAFECPSQESAKLIINQSEINLLKMKNACEQ